MAELSSDGKYVTVEKGDTLSEIAEEFLGSAKKYQELASINGISNPNLISVGQKIYLTKDAASSGSGSGSSSKKSDSNRATVTRFGLQSTSENTLFATWSWDKSNTENYEISWKVDKGDGFWYENFSTTDLKQATFSFDVKDKRVKFNVKPVSKTKSQGDKEVKYWTASWSTDKVYNVSDLPPAKLDEPDVKIENFKLTATLEEIDAENTATEVEFQVVKDNTKVFKSGKAKINTRHASYSCTVTAGSEYKVRCRGVKGKVCGEWSDYSNNQSSGPAAPSGITKLEKVPDAPNTIRIEWAAVANAKSYKVEYTTNRIFFDSNSNVSSVSVDKPGVNHAIIPVDPGEEYFFRVQAINDGGESAWTAVKSIAIGKKPAAPTTWSSSTTVMVEEPLILYWVHNGRDDSKWTFSELEVKANNVKLNIPYIENKTTEEDEDKTNYYEINTSKYTEGTTIKWKARTAGITKDFGDWSIERTVNVYAPPNVELDVTDKDGNRIELLTTLPFNVHASTKPDTQKPIGYYVAITANEIYETIDNVGNIKMVNQGEVIYSKHFDINTDLNTQISAGDLSLENNISYTLTCVASMDSGLTAESTCEFTVAWEDMDFDVNAEISIDEDIDAAYVNPYCERYQNGYFKAVLGEKSYERSDRLTNIIDIDNVYTETGEIVYLGSGGQSLYYCITHFDDDGNSIEPRYYVVSKRNGIYTKTIISLNRNDITDVRTDTGETVFLGSISGEEITYCIGEEHILVEDVTLSVYRREFDGRFVELATGIENTKQTFITDPHPALDYARYRIVGIDKNTGSVNYVDLAGIPVNEKAVVIQWDEQWSTFYVNDDIIADQPSWSGSMLKLPYNIDVSDSNSLDVSLVKYIGRKHPVSYYGTQLGNTASWNMDIDKRDEETLYALRRLAIWTGDVYVREPSGSGYWANISVSFSQKHCEVTIPVSLSLTRVEGGI